MMVTEKLHGEWFMDGRSIGLHTDLDFLVLDFKLHVLPSKDSDLKLIRVFPFLLVREKSSGINTSVLREGPIRYTWC